MKKDDFTIQLNDKVLVISSENTNSVDNSNMRLNEFNYSSFQRSFRVPETVELEKIKANYKNGILKIKLPKKKDSITKPDRVIDIS
jgi:HSP20 family protein